MTLQGHFQSNLAQRILQAHHTHEHSCPIKYGKAMVFQASNGFMMLCLHMEGMAKHEKAKSLPKQAGRGEA